MNTVEKAALKLHKEAIVDNVDFVYIKDKLLAYKVINLDELETIECEVSCKFIIAIRLENTDISFTENQFCQSSETLGLASSD